MYTSQTSIVYQATSCVTCFWSLGLERAPVTPQSPLRMNFTANLKFVFCMRLQTIKTEIFTIDVFNL